jgi:damage-control phosphatase, subfamily I
MKIYYECFPCFVKQGIRMLKHGDNTDSKHDEAIIRELMHTLGDIDFAKSPPEMTRVIFDIFEKYYSDMDDVYYHEKRSSNQYILEMYDELSAMVKKSSDPFDTAMRLAITGNIIDFGANPTFLNEHIHSDIEKALEDKNLNSALLKEEISRADRILYIGDNAGEIVFDKLFLEQLPVEKITYSVRGSHILNDALIEDAEMVGLTKLLPVISSGSNYPGTILKACSNEFKNEFENADLIISKGQGNYETLSDIDRNIIFMLRIKCPVVARDIDHPRGGFFVGKSKK